MIRISLENGGLINSIPFHPSIMGNKLDNSLCVCVCVCVELSGSQSHL